jgi:hypothetical protein
MEEQKEKLSFRQKYPWITPVVATAIGALGYISYFTPIPGGAIFVIRSVLIQILHIGN